MYKKNTSKCLDVKLSYAIYLCLLSKPIENEWFSAQNLCRYKLENFVSDWTGPNAIRNNKQTASTQKRNAIEIIKRKKTAMSSTTFEGIRTISCI